MGRYFHSWTCAICGGNTSMAGFAGWAHKHSYRHIAALRALGTEADLREAKRLAADNREREARRAAGKTLSARRNPALAGR